MLRRLLLVHALPVFYVLADIAVWVYATPLGFQRFGSIGVLLAAALFGLDRALRVRWKQSQTAQELLVRAEIWLISLGTLQWGYGDLFHCWSSGHGWQMCG